MPPPPNAQSCFSESSAAVLKVWSEGPSGVPETLSGVPQGQNSFHSNTKMLFALFTGLTFALMMLKPKPKTSQCRLPHCQAFACKEKKRKRKEPVSLKNVHFY